MRLLLTTFVLLQSMSGFAQSDRIELLVSSRVDTASREVRSILQLYENYLNSNPHSITDNPYWNTREKGLYQDFDFSRSSMFQGGMDASQLYGVFMPFVMSIEAIGSRYQIRTMFSSSTTDPQYAGSKVWCIQKLNAIQENGTWVLENLMVQLSESWKHKKVGSIEYVYPPSHHFSEEQSKLAAKFCDDVKGRFNPNFNETFKYYVTSTVDDMGLMENFDYYFVGVTTGKARETMILTAKGNEHYPHEFVHKLLPKNEKRGYVIEEGLAVFLGTKQDNKEYEKLMSKLARDLKMDKEKFNFQSVVSQEIRFNGYQTAYPAGAAICELVYEVAGDGGLKELLAADTSDYERIVASLVQITGKSIGEIALKWTAVFAKYDQ